MKDPADGKPYYSTFQDFTLARYRVAGSFVYGLSRGKKVIGLFPTAQGASSAARQLMQEG